MFYFLIFNSSISKTSNPNKRILTTLLYGSVSYICFHAILTSSENNFLLKLRQYFWLLAIIDFISSIYLYNELCDSLNFEDNIFSKLINAISTLLNNLLNSRLSEIQYTDISDFNNIQNDKDYNHSSNNSNNNNKSILKNNQLSVSFNDDKNEIRNYNINDTNFNNTNFNNTNFNDTNLNDTNLNDISMELKQSNNEMTELNKQLLNLQKQHNEINTSSTTLATDISTIRNTQRKLQNNNNLEFNNNMNNNLEFNNIKHTEILLKNKEKLDNNDLINIKMNYDPNINTDIQSNLKLENFNENPFEIDNIKTEIDNQYNSYTNNLASTNSSVKDNFLKQMEEFNKKKESILQKELEKKNSNQSYQSIYNSNIDNMSVISNNSDIASNLDFDMDEFASIINN